MPKSKSLVDIFPKAKFSDEMLIYIYGNEVETKFSDETQDNLFALEDNSWWFKYRAEVIHNIFLKFLNTENLTIDIGGGNGYTTNFLEKRNINTALLEPALEACANAKKRGLNNIVCGVLSDEDVTDNSIDQAMLLDVLEHIENDVDFLKLLNKKMLSEGKALITVPAMKILWSSEDDSAGHFRRYNLKLLKETAEKAGFKVEYINYFFEFGVLPILLIRVLFERIGLIKRSGERDKNEKKKIADNQFRQRSGIIGTVLNVGEKIELKRLVNNKKVGFGSSLICVIKKV